MSDSKPDSSSSSSSLHDNGVHFLCDDISDLTVKPVIEWILEEGFRGKRERLQLIVNSRGGGVLACFALTDVMLGSKIPIDTTGLGSIASSGLGVFLAGERRIITPNTCIISHQYSSGAQGKYHELVADRKGQDWLSERLIDFYCRRTKLAREVVTSKLMGPSDVFIDAKEAVELGIAHEIRLQ